MIREAILQSLKDQKKSQRRAAFDCGLDPINFNKFLRGERPIPLSDIEKILKYLNLNIKY